MLFIDSSAPRFFTANAMKLSRSASSPSWYSGSAAVNPAIDAPTTVPSMNSMNTMTTTMINAARNAGMRCCCIHNIGLAVINVRNAANRKGMSKAFAACIP